MGELLRSREETFLAMTMSSARLSHPAFIRGNRLPQTDQPSLSVRNDLLFFLMRGESPFAGHFDLLHGSNLWMSKIFSAL